MMMLRQTLCVLLFTASWCSAQVQVGTAIEFTGASDTDRGIQGLAAPVRDDAAITVEGALLTGNYTWCSASLSTGTVVLQAAPAVSAYADGLLLRFAMPATVHGNLSIQCGTLPAVPLQRLDGLAPTPGQLTAGRIAEVLYAGGRFLLLNAMENGCPAGFLQANERICMEVTATPNMLYHDGLARCANMGAKMCTWDEYIAGCTVLQGQLQNLFADWEWLDDSSNHAHGADQAGRTTCLSQRHISPIPTYLSSVRCCYRPR